MHKLDNNELDNAHIEFFVGLVSRYNLSFLDKYVKDLDKGQNQF